MARVWFVQRAGGVWKVPGGLPAYEALLRDLIFKLDLGWQRRLADNSRPQPAPGPQPTDLQAVKKVLVEVSEADLQGAVHTSYQAGWYDSPYSPAEVARRLGPPQWVASATGARG